MSLKEAAQVLAINYSTAKTIVQTFRREKRVAKKPKHCIETKKGIKHENLLKKALPKCQVQECVSRILQSELICGADKKIEKAEASNFDDVPKETSTVQSSGDSNNPPKEQNGFHRVVSASQMKIMVSVAAGPDDPIELDEQSKTSKPIFLLYSDYNVEDNYKDKVDYNDRVQLRVKAYSKQENKLPSLQFCHANIQPKLNFFDHPAITFHDELPKFDFKLCKEDIYYSPFER